MRLNFFALISNIIWIFSMALAVAVFSIAYYQSQISGKKIKVLLQEPKYILPLNISVVGFCLGMALTSDRWWEILLWIVLIGLFSYQIHTIRKLNIQN